MFHLRLGLKLGKSLHEIQMLPAKEVRLWKLFYMVEPWGFEEDEFRAARDLAFVHNMNAGKGKGKPIAKFARNMRKLSLQVMARMGSGLPDKPIDVDSVEGRQALTETAIAKIKQMFPGVVDARKK
jgi:hypothetical protein